MQQSNTYTLVVREPNPVCHRKPYKHVYLA